MRRVGFIPEIKVVEVVGGFDEEIRSKMRSGLKPESKQADIGMGVGRVEFRIISK
ncbi:MAG: hypothetical protein ACTSRP_18895 [Candidatus Helarchaeota archaeon]